MDITMESDAMSEISDISAATTSTRSKRLRFRPAKKQKQGKSENPSASDSTSKSSSILTLSRRNKQMKSQEKGMSEDVASPTSLTAPDGVNDTDAAIRFAGQGVTFKAKLIGVDPVTGPRGDQMCKNAMTRLKAIVKGTGSHKRKVLLSISMDGLKLLDEKTGETISQHPIPLISYISRDTSDNRAFGFVFGSPAEGHQFIGLKTEKAAIPVMQTIADLFTFVYEQRKREKSLAKEPSSSRTSPAVLSFGVKEEFSTEKVNAAWSRTEPSTGSSQRVLKSVSATGSPSTGSAVLPLPLPPPAGRMSDSLTSRTSTMNSMQSSDALSELRAMRHVINSVRDASASDSRYATWESFNENDANDTISQFNSQVSAAPSPRPNFDTNSRSATLRTGSDASSDFSVLTQQKSFNSQRLPGIGLPAGVLVPSPPSSPRSTSSRSGRLRRTRGVDQPNVVFLPPVTGNSASKSSAYESGPLPPPLSHMFPGTAGSFPARSEPDLFSDKSDKFEVNFDAVFSKPSLGPSAAPLTPPSKQADPPQTAPPADPNDRYACFQEIQNLDAFPSIFDNPSSSSDSDTFVASPAKSLSQSVIAPATGPPVIRSEADQNLESDLFGSSNWSAPPQACAISFPPPLVPVPVNQMRGPTDENKDPKEGIARPSDVVTNPSTSAKAILKDVATSPGTPPHVTSHNESSHQHESSTRNDSSHDPFSSLDLKDFQRPAVTGKVDSSLFFQELKVPPKQSLQDMGSQATATQSSAANVLTNRVGAGSTTWERRESETERKDRSAHFSSNDVSVCPSRDRPPSAASSVASSQRNPFASTDDMDDVRSTHSNDNEAVYSSCPTPASPASMFHSAQAAGHMARSFVKHAAPAYHPVLSHRYDAFPFAHPPTPYFPSNLSSAFDTQFSKAPPAPHICHHMSHATHSQMHPQMDCECRFFYRHPDPRVPDVFQHPDPRYQYFQRMQQMYQQHQQKTAPTEFGSSFEFDTDFESFSRGMDARHVSQWGYPSHGHHDHDPFSPAPDSRCLSPNNPFNPIFGAGAFADPHHATVPPPRPPARVTDMRRTSFESDASPPPLPKRKSQPMSQVPHNYHNAPREPESSVYACPPGDQNYGSMGGSDSPPPLPLPSRKKGGSVKPLVERRVSFDTPSKPVEDPNDPFSVAHIEKRLNQVSMKHNSDRILSAMDRGTRFETSTPVLPAAGHELKRQDDGFLLSSIRSEEDGESNTSIGTTALNDTSVFESSSSPSVFDSSGYKRLQDDAVRVNNNNQKETNPESQEKRDVGVKEGGKKGPFQHFGEEHISPEERNIFRAKDPFAGDDFFAP